MVSEPLVVKPRTEVRSYRRSAGQSHKENQCTTTYDIEFCKEKIHG